MEEFANVNWLAVGAGTIVSFLTGWAWYSPKMFGSGWAEGSGVSLDTVDKMPVFALATNFLALFLLALVVGITASTNALLTAVLAIVAMALYAASMGGFIFKSAYAIKVDFGFIIVCGAIMIAFQALL